MIGAASLRREDPRLLTGRGHYLADITEPGLCHIALLRSPLAHARIQAIDTSAASALAGVVAVVTAADLAHRTRPLTHRLPPDVARPVSWGLLAADRVRFVGEPLAAVAADSRAVAEDAVELIEVDYDPLPPLVDAEAALADDAPLLFPEWGTNEILCLSFATPGLDAALTAAPHVLSERFENHRVIGLPLEGHGARASVDPSNGTLVVHASNQQPHQLRTVIAETCGRSESDVRVIAPDMGGGFGNKQHFTREECLVAALALLVERPVQWLEDRSESLTASIHSRPQVHHVTAGFDDDGRLLAYRARVVSDVGAPFLYFSGVAPSLVTVGSITGGYAVPQVGFDLSCVATTTCPVGAYRGFGQPQAHFATERTLDLVAEQLGLDPLEVRRRNLLPDQPRPWRTPTGSRVDVGSLAPQVDQLVAAFDYAGWRTRQAQARDRDRALGIGVSTLVQGTAPTQHDVAGRFGSFETASVSVLPDGHVTITVGTKSQGQGHATVLAQIASDVLGVDLDSVTVRDGDTASLPYGMGTWGSRSAVMGGGAVLQATREVQAKVATIAAAMPGQPSLTDVAEQAWWHPECLPLGTAPGLTATVCYTPGFTGPQPGGGVNHDETYGSHMTAVAVEVDLATGEVTVLDAVLVSDCGTVINPLVVEGQHRGAFTQGLGAVLFEELAYDDEGQPLCSTLLDYTVPLATETPRLRVLHRETPAETAGGFRGVGEAAIIAAPAALAGAVHDALRPSGVRITSTRLHARDLRELLRTAGHRPDPAAFAAAGDHSGR